MNASDNQPDAAARGKALLARFVEAREAGCPSCGYSVRGLRSDACPECGGDLRLSLCTRAAAPASYVFGLVVLCLAGGDELVPVIVVAVHALHGSASAVDLVMEAPGLYVLSLVQLVLSFGGLGAWIAWRRRIVQLPPRRRRALAMLTMAAFAPLVLRFLLGPLLV